MEEFTFFKTWQKCYTIIQDKREKKAAAASTAMTIIILSAEPLNFFFSALLFKYGTHLFQNTPNCTIFFKALSVLWNNLSFFLGVLLSLNLLSHIFQLRVI